MNLRKDHSKQILQTVSRVLTDKGQFVPQSTLLNIFNPPVISFRWRPQLAKILYFPLKKDHDGGYIGFWNDEERSETRYLMRIAEFSESSSFRTQLAIIGYSFDCAFLTCKLNNSWRSASTTPWRTKREWFLHFLLSSKDLHAIVAYGVTGRNFPSCRLCTALLQDLGKFVPTPQVWHVACTCCQLQWQQLNIFPLCQAKHGNPLNLSI